MEADIQNYERAPALPTEVGNRAATSATVSSDTIPGLFAHPPPSLNNPPPLNNPAPLDEPPAAQRGKRSKKLKVNDTHSRQPSEYEVSQKAMYLWSKSAAAEFSTKANEELKRKSLPFTNRLSILNRLITAAWDALSKAEQLPWIENATDALSAELPLEQKNKKAVKKIEKTAQSVLKEYGNWSFWVLWGETDANFGQAVIRGNSPTGPNFQSWFNATYPEECKNFMDRLGEYLDSGLEHLKQERSRDKAANDAIEDKVTAVNGQVPPAIKEILDEGCKGNVHELRKLVHLIMVSLWKSAGWQNATPWTKIAKNPRKYCNSSFLPNWWLYSNPASSTTNKETLTKMFDYLKKGSDGLLPVGHSFRFYSQESSRAEDRDGDKDGDEDEAMNEDEIPVLGVASNNGGPSTSSTAPPTTNTPATDPFPPTANVASTTTFFKSTPAMTVAAEDTTTTTTNKATASKPYARSLALSAAAAALEARTPVNRNIPGWDYVRAGKQRADLAAQQVQDKLAFAYDVGGNDEEEDDDAILAIKQEFDADATAAIVPTPTELSEPGVTSPAATTSFLSPPFPPVTTNLVPPPLPALSANEHANDSATLHIKRGRRGGKATSATDNTPLDKHQMRTKMEKAGTKRTIKQVLESDQALGDPVTAELAHPTRASTRKKSKNSAWLGYNLSAALFFSRVNIS